MLTVGGTLLAVTVTLMGAEFVTRSPLSVARAVKMYGVALAATFANVKLYAEVVSLPTTTPSTRNSTLVTVPGAVSAATAVIGILAGAVKVALLSGAVMLTVGGTLLAVTVTLIGAEFVTRPPLSVARAVKMYGVALAATFANVKLYADVVSLPTTTPSTRKSTLVTVPGAVSAATAVIGILAGAVKVALLSGAVMLTVGGTLLTTPLHVPPNVVGTALVPVQFARNPNILEEFVGMVAL